MPSSSRCSWPPLVTLALATALVTTALPAPCLASQPPAPASAAEPEAPPQVGFRIDTTALGDGHEALRDKLRERGEAIRAERGFVAASDERDPQIVIVVEATGSVEQPGFVVGTSIERGDEIVPGSAGQLECSLCTRTELVARIEAALPELLALAREHQRDAGASGGGEGGQGSGGPEGPEPPPASVTSKPIGPLGYAGVGLAVVGLAGVGIGAGLIGKGVEPLADRPAYQKNFRTPGFVALGLGGAVLVAGVVAVVVDVSQRKRQRAGQARVRAHGIGVAF